MNIFQRIGNAISRLNRRLAGGSTGGAARDVSMLRAAEREQFESEEDEKRQQ